jgi:hypothetical protein
MSVANQLVTLDRYADIGTVLESVSGRTDENGEVHFSQMPAGMLRFVIRCPGCSPTEILATRVAPGEEYKYGTITLNALKSK